LDVTIIIPQYKTPELIRKAYVSMRRFYPGVPMIIVDDGSCDESTEQIERIAGIDSYADALIMSKNRGHGPAVHAGILAATTKRVFVMDSDCIVESGGFLEMMETRMIKVGLYGTGVIYHRDWCHGNNYLSCVAAMYDRDVYLELPVFRHAGDPLDENMAEAARRGLAVECFPIFDYLWHKEMGTRDKYGEDWDLTGVKGQRILVYGSAYLSEICTIALQKAGYNIVGYVKNRGKPTVPGIMPVCEVTEDIPHDVKLSIQFDRQIDLDHRPGFNLHTGTLPDFGGFDVLYHTLRRGAKEQGMTFHGMTDRFDQGPIITAITYPVVDDDTMVDLYQRMTTIAPNFIVTCMDILNSVGLERVPGCAVSRNPVIYKRGLVSPGDQDTYRTTPEKLRHIFNREYTEGDA